MARWMNARLARIIETGAELIASTAFAGAIGFATDVALGSSGLAAFARPASALGTCAGFLLSMGVTRAMARLHPVFGQPRFRPGELPSLDDDAAAHTDQQCRQDELLLRDEQRVEASRSAGESELLELEDALELPGPDARVVRLFDRKAMPTPGELQSQIVNHLSQRRRPHDDSQALSDALAELKRSLG